MIESIVQTCIINMFAQKTPRAPVKKPATSRADIESPESPTKHTKTYTKYTSLKQFFQELEIIIQK